MIEESYPRNHPKATHPRRPGTACSSSSAAFQASEGISDGQAAAWDVWAWPELILSASWFLGKSTKTNPVHFYGFPELFNLEPLTLKPLELLLEPLSWNLRLELLYWNWNLQDLSAFKVVRIDKPKRRTLRYLFYGLAWHFLWYLWFAAVKISQARRDLAWPVFFLPRDLLAGLAHRLAGPSLLDLCVPQARDVDKLGEQRRPNGFRMIGKDRNDISIWKIVLRSSDHCHPWSKNHTPETIQKPPTHVAQALPAPRLRLLSKLQKASQMAKQLPGTCELDPSWS